MTQAVYFFGGYLANRTDVNAWADSAKAQRSDLTVFAFPYPAGATAANPLAVWKDGVAVAQHIKGSVQDCVIIGHSSGCALANDVAERALHLGAENFRLVALDGFCPSADLLALPVTQVWSAENSDGTRSLNYAALLARVGGRRLKVFCARGCHGWALHFSLVNARACDATVKVIAAGYARCEANLMFLNKPDREADR